MIILIDNYDSFTYNIVQVLGSCFANPEHSDIRVYRNDSITASEVFDLHPDGIILSPGPCTPTESGVCLDILQYYKDNAANTDIKLPPLLGICLGHQAIGHVFGSHVTKGDKPVHGKTSMISHQGESVFQNLPAPLEIARYHSLIVQKEGLSEDLTITATSNDDNQIMGLMHKNLPIHGIQFHPESVATLNGMEMLRNFKDICFKK